MVTSNSKWRFTEESFTELKYCGLFYVLKLKADIVYGEWRKCPCHWCHCHCAWGKIERKNLHLSLLFATKSTTVIANVFLLYLSFHLNKKHLVDYYYPEYFTIFVLSSIQTNMFLISDLCWLWVDDVESLFCTFVSCYIAWSLDVLNEKKQAMALFSSKVIQRWNEKQKKKNKKEKANTDINFAVKKNHRSFSLFFPFQSAFTWIELTTLKVPTYIQFNWFFFSGWKFIFAQQQKNYSSFSFSLLSLITRFL